ncbi:MAG: hypothetical protein RLZZ585_304 [Bacteroidota bacterium]|jgi:hypothetical protein
MKNLYFIFLLFVSVNLSAQTKGITYQAIIYNPSGESIPGVNNATAPMANKSVCLQFSIIDASSQIEYQEAISTTTDEYGMVNLVIGNGVQSSGYASSFSTITWSVDQKSLKVALDIAGQCSDFVDISSQKFESVPYAFSANTADHISGILPIENGGTNATTVLDAKTNLGLENVDNTSDLNKPISNATQAALDIKEDQINKSALTTLGTSDVLYPTQNAVKTYVDAGTNNINAAITNEAAIRAAADATLTTNLATEVNNRINGDNTLTTNLATEVTNRINGDNTLTTNLATEVLNRTNADVVLTNNLATEVTNRTNADLLKEDLSNKSTATTLGTSDILYPTQNAVKTYVDATSTTNTTAINNEAAIRAAADVVLTNNLAIEVTNRANADLLKENLTNKSTATTLGTSDVLYPSQNAVKTYVDANATTNATAISNEAAIRAAADIVLTNNLATEVTDRTNADLLKENLSNKSTSVNLGLSDVEYPSQKAVKTYVDAASNSTNNALNNEAIIRAAADNNLTINLAAEVSSRTIGDNNLNAAVLTEVTTRTNADLLKENLANKSTSTALGTSDVLYPSQNAVKTYVDASALTINSTISNEASIRAAADLQLNTNLTSEINDREDADLLKEDLSNKSDNLLLDGTSIVKYPTVKTVKDYVDSNATMLATDLTNESLARAAGDNTLTTNLVSEANNRINADLLKENLTNKSTATTLGTSDVLYPTQNAVKSYVDATVSVGNAGINNEAAIRAAADAVLTTNLTTEIANRSNADLSKENLSNKSTATTLGTSNVLYPTQNAVKTYVDAQVATINISDADATTKGKIQLAGDLSGTAAAPTVPGLALKAPIVSPNFTGTPTAPTAAAGTNTPQVATTEFVTGAIASATIPDATTSSKGKIQLAGDLSGTASAPVVAVNAITTSKIQDANVTDAKIATVSGSKVTGNITGSAANVTGVVPVANGGTGQTTIAAVKSTLGLSGTNVAIGAASGTTNQGSGAVGLGNGTGQTNQGSQSVAIGYVAGNSNQGANSVAIGSNAAQGGQGTQSVAIGLAANSSANNATALGAFASAGHTNATAIGYQAVTTGSNTIQLGADGVTVPGSTAITNVKTSGTLTAGAVTYPNTHGSTGQVLSTTGSGTLTWVAPSASSLSGTVAVANGGTGSSSLTGYVKGNGTSIMTASANIPVADVTGAAPLASPSFTGTPTAPTAAANTSTTQVATTAFVSSALASAGLPSQSGNNGKFLTTNGSTASWAASPGVPYTGATGAVNLGAYNLTVNGVKVGVGSGPDPYFLQYSTVVGKDALVSNTYGWQNNAFGFDAMNQNTTGNGNNAFGLSALRSNTTGNNNVAMGQAALNSSVSGNMNTAIGTTAAYHSLGSQVTSIGYESLMGQSTGTGNTALGWRAGFVNYGTNTFSTFLGNNATAQNGITNATAIGNDAFVNTSNTIQLGNSSITNVKTSGTLTAGNVTYPNNHNSVNGQILTTNGSGVASWTNTIAIANGGTGATTSAAALSNLGAAPLVSPNFTGTPTAPTASSGTNNTQVATTAFVNSSISSANSSLAPISSPSFNGTPTAPTAAANTNTTQIATTAFVANALSTGGLPSQSGNNGKFLTTNGSTASWAASSGVPYSGASGAVNLGNYNLTVYGLRIGAGVGDNNALQNNTVFGKDALINNSNGYHNIAVGNTALYNNVGGYANIAIGNESQGLNYWGFRNTSVGQASLYKNTGNNNTAVGFNAGYFINSSGNTAIGSLALDGQGDGGGNTGVGYNAGAVSWDNRTYNSTFLGYNAKSQNGLDNVIVIGYNAYTNEHNTIQLGNTSIVKLKTSGTIWSNGTQLTSDARLKTNIQPLQNSLDIIMKLNPVHYDKKNSIESTDYNKSENGFIAQEIQKVLPFVVKEGNDQDKILSVDYNSVIPVLTKGIQEQQLQIEAQQKQIDEMKMLIEKLLKEKK